MNLVKLTCVDGDPVWVNPQHVQCVSTRSDEAPIPDETSIWLAGQRSPLRVEGAPQTVAFLLAESVF